MGLRIERRDSAPRVPSFEPSYAAALRGPEAEHGRVRRALGALRRPLEWGLLGLGSAAGGAFSRNALAASGSHLLVVAPLLVVGARLFRQQLARAAAADLALDDEAFRRKWTAEVLRVSVYADLEDEAAVAGEGKEAGAAAGSGAPEPGSSLAAAAARGLAAAALAAVLAAGVAHTLRQPALRALAASGASREAVGSAAVAAVALLVGAGLLWRRRVEPAASRPAQSEAAPRAGGAPLDVNGRWVKDRGASDSMMESCRMIRLPWLLRKGVALIKGMDLVQEGTELQVRVFSEVPLLRVVERHGRRLRRNRRRDMRRGGALTKVVMKPTQVEVHFKWGATSSGGPAGSETNLLVLKGPDELHVYHRFTVGDRTITYRQVYVRR